MAAVEIVPAIFLNPDHVESVATAVADDGEHYTQVKMVSGFIWRFDMPKAHVLNKLWPSLYPLPPRE